MEQIIHNDLLERAGILEEIRKKPRDLIKFIPENERVRYDNDFTDDILSMGWNESQLDNDDLDLRPLSRTISKRFMASDIPGR